MQAFKRARMVAAGSGIALSEAIPGPAVSSDEAIKAYIRGATVPIHHAASTCKINLSFSFFLFVLASLIPMEHIIHIGQAY